MPTLEELQQTVDALVPAGTVVAFASDKIPAGWLLCDGNSLDKNDPKFQRLFEAIGTIHGGNANPKFQLPDYRGLFLRGVDRGSGRDKDVALRLPPGSGNTGNGGADVGSIQGDATRLPSAPFETDQHEGHSHGDPTWNGAGGSTYELATTDRAAGGFDYGSQSAPTTKAGEHHHTVKGGDKETRPVNAYVNYIIKL